MAYCSSLLAFLMDWILPLRKNVVPIASYRWREWHCAAVTAIKNAMSRGIS